MSLAEFNELIHGIGLPGIICRLILALLCGGAIGMEREQKRRAAGFRTHTLICIGATLTTLISMFLIKKMELPTDPARLGAQVIAGMSFIGAGAIIVTSRQQVKGLTTAAGLWTSAIIGLAIGTGYYWAAAIAVIAVLLAETLLSKFEYFIVSTARVMTVHVEFTEPNDLDKIIARLVENNMTVTDLEYAKSGKLDESLPGAIFTIHFKKKTHHDNALSIISETPGVQSVEEL